MASLLRVENLITAFDTDAGKLVAVDGVSFSVERGKTLGIVGESGCGKSVSAFSITRLLPQPHGKILGGRVLFEGRDLVTLPDDELRHIRGKQIGVIFQEPMTALNPVQRIGKQLTEAILLHDRISAADARERVIEMLKRVRIPAPETRIDEYPHQLSGGMRQRVMIAMALIHKPKLLIADEPTTALDVTVQAQILELISDLQKEMGMAVVLITHDLGVIAETCDEVAVMYAGRIVERAEVHELFANPRHAYTRGLLESIPRLDSTPKTRLKVIAGNVPSISDFKPGCRFAERSGKEHSLEQLNTRPAFVEVSPNHWVEACPVCTGFENASDSRSCGIQTTNTHHESTRRTAPPSALESAQSHLGTSAGADRKEQDSSSRTSQREEQLRALLVWAKDAGKLIPADRYLTHDEMGTEHRVYFDASRCLAIKVTNPNRCGRSYCNGEPYSATPLEYLARWQMQNAIFGDDAELEGVIESPSGIALVMRQRWIVGVVPEEERITALLGSLGFEPTLLPECYYRASDDIAVMDCHDGNFIKLENGLVVPIDVIPLHPDEGLKQRLGLRP
jgi:oligopeptide/dipeptide ABC transporter ATP-binding protein